MALPKKQKLKDRRVFRNTRKLKFVYRTPFFRILGQPKNLREITLCSSEEFKQDDLPKVAFVISKKKLKLAVKRNKAKRRTEEAYRSLQKTLFPKIKNFEYLIFFLESDALEADFELLRESLIKAFQKYSLKGKAH